MPPDGSHIAFTPARIITGAFVSRTLQHFALDWSGIHGIAHWCRVRDNGLQLARQTGARTDVIKLFAFLHDVARQCDGWDKEHGQRAAHFVNSRHDSLFSLDKTGLDLLCEACAGHSDGMLEADITVQTCWDADRLDLGRIGVAPDPAKLCTTAGRDPKIMVWAYRRSREASEAQVS